MFILVFEDPACHAAVICSHRRPFGLAEQVAEVVDSQVQAALASRLAIGHARHRGGDGRGDAAGTTALTTVHGYSPK